MDHTFNQDSSAGASNRLSRPSLHSNDDVLLLINYNNTHPVPLSRVVQESSLLRKRYSQCSKPGPKLLRLPKNLPPTIMEGLLGFLNSRRHYMYPNISIDLEIDFHIRICELADDLGMNSLWDTAFECCTKRLRNNWLSLAQYQKEHTVNLVYGECEVKSDRMMKNALINEIARAAIQITRNRKLGDDYAYGHARLAFNSLMAVAAKVEDDCVRDFLIDLREPLTEIASLYLNARRDLLGKKSKSSKMLFNEATEMVRSRRVDSNYIPEKEWRASEYHVVIHWVVKMFEWHRHGYAKDELFDNNSRNPFGGAENETAEWLEGS